ncbi:hypothetical protein G6L26_007430 [Agrobacterium radiobacter]|uniref:Uncharacterized protein n=1 Tax=Agrobacterium tumefaciens str. B6 TaxID=1183423 RepID=A0A822UZ80_AGRTU|nr:hypothetical protein [Agrobacterium tumefaciens]KWT88012.1 hypothetical protein ASB65_18430 [Agrobacterium tumefaciens str. B6]MQB28192.1 hypothetical protein [Agrobacterium tumefaciens]NTA05003.1 hypothetical protein [Agrobacterium tumefaciens]NTA91598.1 hypothetical protein [Agrobacterium tumefaciens]NTB12748.1 hypothetical protein [Agrobacterium tumefaciens]
MRKELLGKIVDEVFDGGIEDASIIEKIYAVIEREEIRQLRREKNALQNARQNNLRQIGELTLVLKRNGLMDEASKAIRDAAETGELQ